MSMSYQSDATPTKTTETFIAKCGLRRIVRSGLRTGEYVLHRSFFTAIGGHRAVLFEEPRRVSDKTTSTHLHVARSILWYPFRHGLRTVNISHVVFDGALFESLSSAVRRDHSMALRSECRTLSPGDAQLLALQSWFVSTPCMDHGCQTAVRWGLRLYLQDKELMSTTWQVIESARTCFSTLVDHKSMWISSRLVFRDWTFQQQHVYTFWTLLGFGSGVAEQLATVQLRF